MSKLDREITAVFDEAFWSANGMMPVLVECWDDDLKQIFREAGWKEPE